MKIVEIIPELSSGGAQRFLVDLCNELIKYKDNDIIVVSLQELSSSKNNFYQNSFNPKIKVISLKGKDTLFSKVTLLFKLYFYILSLKPDIVHSHLTAFNYIILPSLQLKRTTFYYTVHNIAEEDTKPGIQTLLKKIFFSKKIIKPITISPLCTKSFFSYFQFKPFLEIYNGCRDLNEIAISQEVEKEIISYKKDDDTKVLINIARIMPQKNHQLLIDCINQLGSKGYNFILLVIGASNNDSYSDKIIEQFDQSPYIHYLGRRSNIENYLYFSDALCLSSQWEGLPITLLEAGLLGKYAICTPVGGIPDVIINKHIGFLSKDISTNKYLAALEEFLNHPSYDMNFIKNYYNTNYSMQQCAKQYYKSFEKNIQNKNNKQN